MDAIDRFYALANTADARGCSKINYHYQGHTSGWSSLLTGESASIVVERGNTFYVRYVPRESVQWLFDAHAQ